MRGCRGLNLGGSSLVLKSATRSTKIENGGQLKKIWIQRVRIHGILRSHFWTKNDPKLGPDAGPRKRPLQGALGDRNLIQNEARPTQKMLKIYWVFHCFLKITVSERRRGPGPKINRKWVPRKPKMDPQMGPARVQNAAWKRDPFRD